MVEKPLNFVAAVIFVTCQLIGIGQRGKEAPFQWEFPTNGPIHFSATFTTCLVMCNILNVQTRFAFSKKQWNITPLMQVVLKMNYVEP